MRNPVQRLDALTGLRFVAAAAVVFGHIAAHGPALEERLGRFHKFYGDAAIGPNAVAFFFILSGFILAYVYPAFGSAGEARQFLFARFARLWPGYMVGLLLSMLLASTVFWPMPRAEYHPATLLGLNLAMVQSWIPSLPGTNSYNVPAWSISTEFAFYLMFIPLARNWPRTWWWKLPLLTALPLSVAVAANYFAWPWETSNGQFSYYHLLYFNPICRVWLFALGMTLAHAWRRGGLRAGPLLATLIEVSALVLVGVACAYADTLGKKALDVPWLGLPFYHLLFGCSMIPALPFAWLIYVMASGRGYVSRVLALRPCVHLGEISYALYILHWPLMAWLGRNISAFADYSDWPIFLGAWAVLLVLSHCIYTAVEQPARRQLMAAWKDVPTTFAFLRPVLPGFVIVLLVLAIGLGTSRRQVRFLAPRDAVQAARQCHELTRDIRFSDTYLLRGATMNETSKGVAVRLVWQSLKHQPAGFKIWLQGLDGSPAEECVWAIPQSADLECGSPTLSQGVVWEQRLLIPKAKLDASRQVVLIVWNHDDTAFLPVFGGQQDAHGRLRLLTPAPRPDYSPDLAKR